MISRDSMSPQELVDVINAVVERHIIPRLEDDARRVMEDLLKNTVEEVLFNMVDIELRATIKKQVGVKTERES